MGEIKYPAGETVWARYLDRNGETLFVLTSKATRDRYYLYEHKSGKLVKLGAAKEPPELIEKFGVRERMEK